MEDPLPENISGSKVSKHSFEHSVEWGKIGYSAVGLAGLYLLYKLLWGGGSSEAAETASALATEQVAGLVEEPRTEEQAVAAPGWS